MACARMNSGKVVDSRIRCRTGNERKRETLPHKQKIAAKVFATNGQLKRLAG